MRLLSLVVVATLFSCSRPAFQPATVQAPGKSGTALYKAAVRALGDRGLTAETNDPTAGVVVSAWEETEQFGGKTRLRWRVSVDDGRVHVASDCQTKIDDDVLGEGWQPCDPQPEGRTGQAAQLAQEIAANAQAGAPAPEPAPAAPPPAPPAPVQPPAAPAQPAPVDAGPAPTP